MRALPLSFAFVLALGSLAHAAPVYSQTGGTPSFAPFSDVESGWRVADDFGLPVASTIRSVTWDGAYYGTSTPGVDQFTITFFADGGNMPGAVLSVFTIGSAALRSMTGEVAFGANVYRYTADLGSGVSLPAFTQHWISIRNDTTAEPGTWSWMDIGSPNARQSGDGGATWAHLIPAVRFTLDDANLSPAVPEPSSLIIVGLSVVGVALGRRRSRAS